ncbi:capsular polysaccharide transport system permease protein [Burkholderia sp. WP9]|uniref:chain-length determining protein n=1 Tax=Burkholderia sp. WP9 TaxID=1500263 RepID=UPI000896F5EB|nr:chain-length determining protein [Burkholderia sp. WP9]SEF11784.1 capsular polysaccharide transport system permease protein [Burkholderia sp. WP9]
MKEPSSIQSWRTANRLVSAYENAKKTLLSVRVFRLIVRLIVIYAILSIPYWLVVASDRYVSQATVIIQRTDQVNGASVMLPAMVSAAGGANGADQLLLREYLLSEDMLGELDAALDLRSHYSDRHRDPISRMWFKNAPMEWFYQYWLSRIDVEYDDYSGVLRIRAQAYDPKIAQAIVNLMVQKGEAHMNEIGHKLAQSQVDFLSKQVTFAHDRFLETTQRLIAFQNDKGLAAPQATAESINTLIDKLETQKTDVQTQLASLPPNLSPTQPTVAMLRKNLNALVQQIAQKRAELASPNRRTLNYTVDEFQRLQLQVTFAQDLYKTALSALEQGRMDAARTLKIVSALQTPTKPDYPQEPARSYNAFVTLLMALALIGVVKLLESIILDHVD